MVASTFLTYNTSYAASSNHEDVTRGMHIDINDQGPGKLIDIVSYEGDSNKIKAEVWWNNFGGTTDPFTNVYMTIYDKNGRIVCSDMKESDIIGNCYFDVPDNLASGNYEIKFSASGCSSTGQDIYRVETWTNLVVRDPLKDNLNAANGNLTVNASNIIQGQKLSVSSNFVNNTRMANYKNQTPNKNSDLGYIDYVVLDDKNNIVMHGFGSLKLSNNLIVSDVSLNTANLQPGTYHLQSQIQLNSFIKPINSEQTFNVYSKNSSLSVSNESTLNVTQGDDAQLVAWINNDGLTNIPAKNAPKANVTFTVFDQNYNVITGDTFPATLVNGHYVAYMDWNTKNFKPGTYKVHMAVNGNPCISGCDSWTTITIMPK
ncbi:MAG: hypothetical protein NKF70_10340 [Methanobacterium sp. ERen5]|nr:MAG: hypothetical protein NKF70_10340 [Methanobacterium sp. ERen5]